MAPKKRANTNPNLSSADLLCIFFDNKISCSFVIRLLSDRDNSGRTTLENVLNMNVVEYNLKSRLNEEMYNDIDPSKVEKVRKSIEFLKKRRGDDFQTPLRC